MNYPPYTVHRFLTLALASFLLFTAVCTDWWSCDRPSRGGEFALNLPNELRRLHTEFTKINDKWFDGKLPSDTTIIVSNDLERKYMAVTNLEGTHFTISFNPHYMVAETVDTELLFHEMCHLSAWDEYDQHGPKWQKCMTRLADAGAFGDIW